MLPIADSTPSFTEASSNASALGENLMVSGTSKQSFVQKVACQIVMCLRTMRMWYRSASCAKIAPSPAIKVNWCTARDLQVAHAVWQDRDMLTLILRHTHPEVSKCTTLSVVNKLYRVCMRVAFCQNVHDALMPLLRQVNPSILEVDVNRTLSAYVFDKRVPSQYLTSPGAFTFVERYIVESCSRDDRSERLDEITRGMVERLADVF